MFKQRIGITQRSMPHPRYDESLQCLDARWSQLLLALEFLPIPLPTLPAQFVPAQLEQLQLDGLILSGGNDIAAIAADSPSASPARDGYEFALLEAAIANDIPVMGVCRGLQLINVFFGGQLVRVSGHAGTRHRLRPSGHAKAGLSFACPAEEVNSYHDYAIPPDGLGEGLIPLAYDSEGSIEAHTHQTARVLGIMWHPERETPPTDTNLLARYFA